MKSDNHYSLIDSGDGRKLERFGQYILARPASQAVWKPHYPDQWEKAHALFSRAEDNRWHHKISLPESWNIEVSGIRFQLRCTDFGHLGIFPEQRLAWEWIQETISSEITQTQRQINVLNLFAYSGGSTLAAAKAGAHVCHLDASPGMVAWAGDNARLNGLDKAPIRWIIDDVNKFLIRELKRGRKYDAIILDPPTFGRGSKGELFKIEEHLSPLLEKCRALLSDNPLFVLLSCHTPGITPMCLHHMMAQMMHDAPGNISIGEMLLDSIAEQTFPLPSGTYARWCHAAR